MKSAAKISIFILLSVLSFSCYKPVEFIDVQNINFKFKDSKGNVNIILKVHNPNFYKIKIIKSDLDVYLNDQHLGKLNSIEDVSLPANDTSLATITLELNMADMIFNAGNFYQVLKNPAGTKVKITGTITGKTFFGKKDMIINENKTLEAKDKINN